MYDDNYLLNPISQVILKCTVSTFDTGVDISVRDFELITEAETIKDLYICKVIDSDGKAIGFDRIIARVPFAHKIL